MNPLPKRDNIMARRDNRINDAQFWADHIGNIQAVEDAMNKIFISDKNE